MDSVKPLDRSIAPAVREMGLLKLPPLETIVTPSGARINLVDDNAADVTRIVATLRGGIVEAPSAELSTLLAPMLIEGTRGMSAGEIADFFDYRGAWVKSDMAIHRLTLTVNALSSNVEETLPVINRILTKPTFDNEELDQIVRRTAGRLNVERTKVDWVASDNLRRMVYGPVNPLTRSADPDKLGEITPQMLHSYFSSTLNPSNLEFFIAGKVSDSLLREVENLCAEFPTTGSIINIEDIPFNPSDSKFHIHAERPDAQQSAVRMGLVLPGRSNDDFVALRLLVLALGGYFGSRLMLNLREEKGLTYGINAIMLGYAHEALLSISAETDSSTVDTLITETIAEMERMKDPSSYSSEEMERLRSLALTNLAARIDTPLAVMDHYQSSIIAGAPDDYFDLLQRAIREMTAETLSALAAKYFDTSRLYISTAGK